jgi:hypothetical protein
MSLAGLEAFGRRKHPRHVLMSGRISGLASKRCLNVGLRLGPSRLVDQMLGTLQIIESDPLGRYLQLRDPPRQHFGGGSFTFRSPQPKQQLQRTLMVRRQIEHLQYQGLARRKFIRIDPTLRFAAQRIEDAHAGLAWQGVDIEFAAAKQTQAGAAGTEGR